MRRTRVCRRRRRLLLDSKPFGCCMGPAPARIDTGHRDPPGGGELSRTRRTLLGVVLPTPGGLLPFDIGGLAQAIEAAGADSLWVDDHLVQVRNAQSPYPFSGDGTVPWPVEQPRWESLTALAFIAAATRRCTVGTAVLILPQRHVVELAKTTATLDVLSNGRLVLGCGIGWLAEEMAASGWSFATRGARANELLEALRLCWTGRPEGFSGEHVRLPPGLVFEPTPRQDPGPPLLVGGMSTGALTRAARHGDGWLAYAPEPSLDLPRLADQLATVEKLRSDGPRAGAPFRRTLLFDGWRDEPGALLDRLNDFAQLGFDEVIFEPTWDDRTRCIETIAAVCSELGRA